MVKDTTFTQLSHTGEHRVRGFAAYERKEINSVSYGQENKNSVSPCLCV